MSIVKVPWNSECPWDLVQGICITVWSQGLQALLLEVYSLPDLARELEQYAHIIVRSYVVQVYAQGMPCFWAKGVEMHEVNHNTS